MISSFSIKFKIQLIALVGVLGLGLYLYFDIRLHHDNNDLLTSVSEQEIFVIPKVIQVRNTAYSYKQIITVSVSESDDEGLLDAEELALELYELLNEISTKVPTISIETERVEHVIALYLRTANDYLSWQYDQDISTKERRDKKLKRMVDISIQLEQAIDLLEKALYRLLNDKISGVEQQSVKVEQFGKILGCLTLSVIFLLTFWISRSVDQSIRAAVQLASRISEGDYQKRFYKRSSDDMGALLTALDAMRESIKRLHAGLLTRDRINDAMNSPDVADALSGGCNALREEFGLPFVAIYVPSPKGDVNCMMVSSLDDALTSDFLGKRGGIAQKCFIDQAPVTFRFNASEGEGDGEGEAPTFQFLLGDVAIQSITAIPILRGGKCTAVIVFASLKELSDALRDQLDDCLERLAYKIDTYRGDSDRAMLLDSLSKRADDLEALNQENIRISKTKSDSLACMSHEIRTPMNGVLGMLGLLRKSSLSKQQEHYAKLAEESANALLIIINGILDFSKVESGKLEIEAIDFDLAELFGSMAESLAMKVHKKDLELVLDLVGITENRICSDPGRIRQVLVNLVGNAVKFTEVGEIIIKAQLEEVDSKLLLRCSVTDSGIGIEESKLGMLFEAFSQADASTTRRFGGTGLGLTIVKRICQLMGGDITVTSTPFVGSCFTIEIEVQYAESNVESNAKNGHKVIEGLSGQALANKTQSILVVAGHEGSRDAVCAQLQHWGGVTAAFSTAEEAFTHLEASAEVQYDLALVDSSLPDMEGAEFGKRLRAMASATVNKCVLMASMIEEIEAVDVRGAGYDSYFRKPATREDLLNALKLDVSSMNDGAERGDDTDSDVRDGKAQVSKAAAVSGSNGGGSEAREGVRILLVEDNMINQEVLLGILEDFKIEPDIANNGEEALEQLNKSRGGIHYDIVLMDCQMPVMDGYESTRRIRKGEAGECYRSITIIALTANSMKGDREKCLAAGMSDYLSKPIDPDELEEKLKEWSVPRAG